VEAYRELGIEATLTPRPRGDGSSEACYLHTTAADLSLGALKLSGSAQVWHGSTVLQHGSFVVSRDTARESRVFGLGPGDARRLADETLTISDVLDVRPSRGDLVSAVVAGIESGLGVSLEAGGLTPHEEEMARGLLGDTDPASLRSRGRVTTSR
jgi:lipoate-protein ligase A